MPWRPSIQAPVARDVRLTDPSLAPQSCLSGDVIREILRTVRELSQREMSWQRACGILIRCLGMEFDLPADFDTRHCTEHELCFEMLQELHHLCSFLYPDFVLAMISDEVVMRNTPYRYREFCFKLDILISRIRNEQRIWQRIEDVPPAPLRPYMFFPPWWGRPPTIVRTPLPGGESSSAVTPGASQGSPYLWGYAHRGPKEEPTGSAASRRPPTPPPPPARSQPRHDPASPPTSTWQIQEEDMEYWNMYRGDDTGGPYN